MASPRKTLWAWTLATFFGAGFGKPGPGTYGSCAALMLWYAAAQLLHPTTLRLDVATTLAAFIATATGIPAATIVAREYGRLHPGSKDPSIVVIDEVAGQFVALIGLTPTPGHALLALGLFRLFDITKPGPIRRLEALPEGLGIMLDDIAAGFFALTMAHILIDLATHIH